MMRKWPFNGKQIDKPLCLLSFTALFTLHKHYPPHFEEVGENSVGVGFAEGNCILNIKYSLFLSLQHSGYVEVTIIIFHKYFRGYICINVRKGKVTLIGTPRLAAIACALGGPMWGPLCAGISLTCETGSSVCFRSSRFTR